MSQIIITIRSLHTPVIDTADLENINDAPETPAPDGSRVLCYDYDCRTTGERLTEIEQQLAAHGKRLMAQEIETATIIRLGQDLANRLAGLEALETTLTQQIDGLRVMGNADQAVLHRYADKLDHVWSVLRGHGIPLEVHDADL